MKDPSSPASGCCDVTRPWSPATRSSVPHWLCVASGGEARTRHHGVPRVPHCSFPLQSTPAFIHHAWKVPRRWCLQVPEGEGDICVQILGPLAPDSAAHAFTRSQTHAHALL